LTDYECADNAVSELAPEDRGMVRKATPAKAAPNARKPAETPVDHVTGRHSPSPDAGGGGSVLATIFGLLEKAAEQAEAELLAAREALAVAERNFAAVMRMQGRDVAGRPKAPQPARKAKEPPAGGARAPRGKAGQRVLDLLSKVPGGLPAGTILDRLQATDDKEKQSVRNALASLSKNGTLTKDGKNYKKA
jgi:hypothetical protein